MEEQELRKGMKDFIEKHFGLDAKWKAEFTGDQIRTFEMSTKSLNKKQISILNDLSEGSKIDFNIKRSGSGLKIELKQNK